MWFKQAQIFYIPDSLHVSAEQLNEALQPLTFTPCLPSLPSSAGWIPPVEGEESLVCAMNDCLMICLQSEDRVLPASVVRQEVDAQIKKIETHEDRKVRHKEKLSLKDEATLTLLPRAFTRRSAIYAYIDSTSNLLIVNSTSAPKIEKMLSLLKKSFAGDFKPMLYDHLAKTLSAWVLQKNYPSVFEIEKQGVLQDIQHSARIIRCQQQNLFSDSIVQLIQDGCEVKQLALIWHDRIRFVLADPFVIRSIRFDEMIKDDASSEDTDTALLQFQASFLLMSDFLRGLLKDLREYCDVSNRETVS